MFQCTSRRGEGYWKLNVSIHKDQEYKALVEKFLTTWIGRLPDYPSIQTWWNECKNWAKSTIEKLIVNTSNNNQPNYIEVNQETTILDEIHN